MGYDFPGSNDPLDSDSLYETPGGEYLTALDEEIGQEEARQIESQRQIEAARQAEMADAESMSVAGDLLIRYLRDVPSPDFGDDKKIKIITEFVVKDLGIRDHQQIADMLPKFFMHSAASTRQRLSKLDKLLFFVLRERQKLWENRSR